MKFNPQLHAKAYLVDNPQVAKGLAVHSGEWALSPEAQDLDILKLDGGNVAHNLAYKTSWALTAAAQNIQVLELCNGQVAVNLASTVPEWGLTPAAQNYHVLSLKDGQVGLALAKHSSEWAATPAAQNQAVLALSDYDIPYWLAKQSNTWPHTSAAYNKNLLIKGGHIFRALAQSRHILSEGLSNMSFALNRYLVAGAFDGIDFGSIHSITNKDYKAIEKCVIGEASTLHGTSAGLVLIARLIVGFDYIIKYTEGELPVPTHMTITYEPLILSYLRNENNDVSFIESLAPGLERDYLKNLYSKLQNQKLVYHVESVGETPGAIPVSPALY